MLSKEELLQRAGEWLKGDPDPECRTEVEAIIRRADLEELDAHFGRSLGFGTAGIRGILGPGPNRMNLAVVSKATSGLCAWLLETEADAKQKGICIGYDGRRMSPELAEQTAVIANRCGFDVKVFDHPVPTPLLAFSVVDRKAAAG